MNLLFERLREYVPGLAASAAEVGSALNLVGLAVERITRAADGAEVLETDITTNRPDLLSYLGTAREIALRFRVPLSPPETEPPEADEDAASLARVVIEEPGLCPRYTARVVRGVRVGESPAWLRRRVEASGIRSISNVVDITNLVLLELGHPIHAFDLDRLEGRRIVVRRARPGETLRTLDDADRALHPDDLLIADSARPVALAGVMGGSRSEIGPGTRDILIESAFFDPRSVRRTSRRHGLRTEASVRFERHADPEVTATAADWAARLVAELASGRVLRGRLDVVPRPLTRPRIRLRLARLEAILGVAVPEADVRRILAGLGFSAGPAGNGELQVEVPGFRGDVEREVDLVEEVGRHFGFDRVPGRLPPGDARPGGRTRTQERERLLREVLAGSGFGEVVTMSVVDPGLDRRAATDAVEPVPIRNPLSDRLSVLRTTLASGLLEVLGHNLRHGAETMAVYEIGRVFLPAPSGGPPDERLRLGLAAVGHAPSTPERALDELDLKGVLDLVAAVLRLGELDYQPGSFPATPARVGWPAGDLGYLRLLPADVLDAFGLHRGLGVYLLEIDLDGVLAHDPGPLRYRSFSRFPAASRDVSLFVEGATYADVSGLIHGVAEPLLESVRLVDRYASGPRVSLAFRLTYRHPSRTLETEEVQAAHQRLLDALARDPRLHLRLG